MKCRLDRTEGISSHESFSWSKFFILKALTMFFLMDNRMIGLFNLRKLLLVWGYFNLKLFSSDQKCQTVFFYVFHQQTFDFIHV